MIRSYRRSLDDDRRILLEQYHYVHAAFKVVGVGSVGTRAWVMLLEGRDQQDPLILQLKEAQPSVLEPYLGKSKASNHGQRVVRGQRLMQAASDILLGWQRTHGIDGVDRDFYVRQLWDAKGSAEVERMVPDGMRSVRRAVRPHPRPRSCPVRRRDRDRRLPRLGRRVRPGDGRLRRGLRRPERAGSRCAAGGHRVGPGRGAHRGAMTEPDTASLALPPLPGAAAEARWSDSAALWATPLIAHFVADLDLADLDHPYALIFGFVVFDADHPRVPQRITAHHGIEPRRAGRVEDRRCGS